MNNYNFQSYNSKPKRGGRIITYILVALISAIIGGFVVAYIAPNYLYGKVIPVPEVFENKNEENEKLKDKDLVEINPNDDLSTVSAVAEKNLESVVGITTVVVQKEWIFEHPKEGVGTGVIIDDSGYILTNSHVIGDGNARSINVLLGNGEQKEAELLWNDAQLDLAIIKSDVEGLPAADLGDSDELIVGELAVAIGNPLGLDFQKSVTSGVISGLHRSIRADNVNVMEDLIQTDASINPGNSGGPLINSKGEVIGINTAKIQSGEGLGFSIPINIVKPVIEEVTKNGSFESVHLGIVGLPVEIHEKHMNVELESDKGVIVEEVVRNSNAHISGIIPGDIILKVDERNVESMVSLKKILYKYRVGDTANMEVLRNGEKINLEIQFR